MAFQQLFPCLARSGTVTALPGSQHTSSYSLLSSSPEAEKEYACADGYVIYLLKNHSAGTIISDDTYNSHFNDSSTAQPAILPVTHTSNSQHLLLIFAQHYFW